MATTIDPTQILRVVDTGTLAPALTDGRRDADKIDHLKVTGNGSVRGITLEADNDDATVDDTYLIVACKGDGGLVIPVQTETDDLPTAPPTGFIVFDAEADAIKVWDGSAYSVFSAD